MCFVMLLVSGLVARVIRAWLLREGGLFVTWYY